MEKVGSKRIGRAAYASSLAFAMLGAAGAQGAMAQTQATQAMATATAMDASPEVSAVDVLGQQPRASSAKYTAPLRDTPQTITVVPREVIRGQNLLSLRDILSTVPGITFGAGEGGGGYGDSINLRGYSANNDITVDGLRDSAQYSRTDPFNLQQLEVVNGANSVYSGSGSVGGSINMVTKAPQGLDQTLVSGALGTDGFARVTVDGDYGISDQAAFRLNFMAHQNDAPGRDVETYKRWGVAPSLTLGLGGPTQFNVSYFHQEDENTPQYGVPYASNAFFNGPLPGVDRSTYFGYRNVDIQEQAVDSVTVRLTHAFSDNLSVRNQTRWQIVTQNLTVDPPQGTFCLANGINPQSGAICTPVSSYLPSGPRGNRRETRNTLLSNQTDLTWRFDTGAVSHTLVAGVAVFQETYSLVTGNVLRNPGGATPNPVLPTMTLTNPNNVWNGPLNFVPTGLSDGELTNRAIYVFDNIKLSPQWELNGGVRIDRNEGQFTTATIAVPYPATGPVTVQAPIAKNSEDLFSWRAGLVFKPVEAASIYLAYGNSQTPSQATVNGGCTLVSTTGTANCNVDPEKATNLELGAKYDMAGGRLSLTGSVFRNERTNFRVASGDPTVPQQQLNGKSRVDGLSLGASGLVRRNWSVFANYTYLSSEILQNISNIAITGGAIDVVKGDPIPLTPEHAFSIWTTYDLPIGVQLGYGATYSGRYAFARPTGSNRLFYAPDYWVHNLAVTWRMTRQADLQLNVKNVFDEDYYNRIRSANGFGWATPGDSRQATVTLNYRF